MAITYVLAPVPKWVFLDNQGEPITNGGMMEVRSSLNPSVPKTVYQDPGGVNPYPPNVLINGNGTAGPFYWELDDANPEDLYFLNILDGEGNQIYSIDDYPIAGGAGGGGGNITSIQPLRNIMVNNSFINNIGATTVQPVPDETFLAPSGHSQFYFPDLKFFREGALNAQDTVNFFKFTPLGTNPFPPDSTPAYYLNYDCVAVPGGGETSKGVRVPLAPFVDTMADQTFTVILKARANSGGNVLNLNILQYFGTGGPNPSADVTSLIATFNLLAGWQEFRAVFSIPSVAGQVLGDSNDDGTYLEILYPLNQATNIDIAKILVLPGDLSPQTSFETVAEIESEAETPRTGDIKISMNAFSNSATSTLQAGWIPLDDGTIGNSASNATTRANADTWLLYELIFDNTAEADCPLFDSGGVPLAKGGTALSNWNDDNQIQLPITVGSVLADRGTGGNPLGENFGSSTHTLTVAEMPSHNHPGSGVRIGTTPNGLSNSINAPLTNLPFAPNTNVLSMAAQGGGQAHNITQPTTYYNMIIKL